MRKSPTAAELDLLVGITMTSLPDSLVQRKTVLVALLYLLPRDYAGRGIVGQALTALHAHDQAQARFQFSGSGNGNGGAK